MYFNLEEKSYNKCAIYEEKKLYIEVFNGRVITSRTLFIILLLWVFYGNRWVTNFIYFITRKL